MFLIISFRKCFLEILHYYMKIFYSVYCNTRIKLKIKYGTWDI